ncbi:hypothetical protein AB0G04_28785 [Actinoplanes sp. NPDC023801]|uniref:hypothetical protein n=1 Tax=Actinoplanes sp. NPDC023801 TaxID=3154595 RepID=UPI003409BA50
MDCRYHCCIPVAAGLNDLPFNPCTLLDVKLQRTQGAHEDAGLRWVGRTVPTLRDLGL